MTSVQRFLLVAAAGTLAGCSGCDFQVGAGTNRGSVEKQISESIETATGVKPSSVSCPGIERGADFGHGPFTCTATVEGQAAVYTVTRTDTVHWHAEAAFILTATLEDKIRSMAPDGALAVVTCPPPRVRVARAGDELECTTQLGGENGWAVVKIQDSDGKIKIRAGNEGAYLGSSEQGSWVVRSKLTEVLSDDVRKETGHAPAAIECAGTGKVVEAIGNETECTVTVDGEQRIYHVKVDVPTRQVSWAKRVVAAR